jgi:hypothetical protein
MLRRYEIMYKVKITSCYFGIWRETIKVVKHETLYELCNCAGLAVEIIEE